MSFFVETKIEKQESIRNKLVKGCTYDDISRLVLIREPFMDVLREVFRLENQRIEEFVVAMMYSNLYMQDDEIEAPIDFIMQVSDVLLDCPMDCQAMEDCFFNSVEKVFENPNIFLLRDSVAYEVDYVQEMEKMASALQGEEECPLNVTTKSYPADPVFELTPGRAPLGDQYVYSSKPRSRNGQLKLFCALESFLTECAIGCRNLVYIGAVPGINIASVALAHPEVQFYLNDLNSGYYRPLGELENVHMVEHVSQLPVLKREETAFFSDIYTGTKGLALLTDQIEYARLFPAKWFSFKILADYGADHYPKLKGARIRTQVHIGGSGETRQWLENPQTFQIEALQMLEFERMMSTYDVDIRNSRFSVASPVTSCNCYDCVVSGIYFIRALTATAPDDKLNFSKHFRAMYDLEIKREYHCDQGAEKPVDILGIEIDPIRTDLHVQRYPGEYLVLPDEGREYFVPPYRYYPNSDTLTVKYNGNLIRAYGYNVGIPCMKHRLPGDFPPTVMISNAMRNGIELVHTCGCVRTYVKGDETLVTYDPKQY